MKRSYLIVARPVYRVTDQTEVDIQIGAQRRKRLWKRCISVAEQAICRAIVNVAVVNLDQRNAPTEMPISIVIHTSTQVNVCDETERRELSREGARSRLGDIGSSRASVKTILSVSDKLTIIVRLNCCGSSGAGHGFHRHDGVHPDVRDGIEITRIVQSEIEHRF